MPFFRKEHPFPYGARLLRTVGYAVRDSMCILRLYRISRFRGRFFLRLPPLEAGGPFELKIRQLPDGPERILHDVWIGEVYLASGQSNMELPLNALREYAEMCASGELDRASVHYFKVPKS
mgnify:CR=1 FL=1